MDGWVMKCTWICTWLIRLELLPYFHGSRYHLAESSGLIIVKVCSATRLVSIFRLFLPLDIHIGSCCLLRSRSFYSQFRPIRTWHSNRIVRFGENLLTCSVPPHLHHHRQPIEPFSALPAWRPVAANHSVGVSRAPPIPRQNRARGAGRVPQCAWVLQLALYTITTRVNTLRRHRRVR